MTDLCVRPPEPHDEAVWRDLWAGYTRFYHAEVGEDVTASLSQKLLRPHADVTALLAVRNRTVIGLAHMLVHASSWSLKPSCYLEDLFVSPAAGGSGVARALMEAVAQAAKAQGGDRLCWPTQDSLGRRGLVRHAGGTHVLHRVSARALTRIDARRAVGRVRASAGDAP